MRCSNNHWLKHIRPSTQTCQNIKVFPAIWGHHVGFTSITALQWLYPKWLVSPTNSADPKLKDGCRWEIIEKPRCDRLNPVLATPNPLVGFCFTTADQPIDSFTGDNVVMSMAPATPNCSLSPFDVCSVCSFPGTWSLPGAPSSWTIRPQEAVCFFLFFVAPFSCSCHPGI